MTKENTNEWCIHTYGESKEHAIRIRLGTNDYYCDFEICSCPNYDETNYAMEVRGSIKWDGCMNWETDPNCMYHCCSVDDVDILAALLKEVWILAKPLLGEHCDY